MTQESAAATTRRNTARPATTPATPNDPTPAPSADADAEEEILGVGAGVEDDLADVSFDPEEFQTGFLEDAEVTIMGFKTQAGGEERDDGKGGTFVTQDNLIIQYRVDNIDGIDATRQYLSLPKTYVSSKDGKVHRRPVSASSKYGLFLGALAGVGVAKRADIATVYKFDNLNDLIGLKMHRMKQTFEAYRNSTVDVEVAVEILGVDNDVRASAGLDSRSLIGA